MVPVVCYMIDLFWLEGTSLPNTDPPTRSLSVREVSTGVRCATDQPYRQRFEALAGRVSARTAPWFAAAAGATVFEVVFRDGTPICAPCAASTRRPSLPEAIR